MTPSGCFYYNPSPTSDGSHHITRRRHHEVFPSSDDSDTRDDVDTPYSASGSSDDDSTDDHRRYSDFDDAKTWDRDNIQLKENGINEDRIGADSVPSSLSEDSDATDHNFTPYEENESGEEWTDDFCARDELDVDITNYDENVDNDGDHFAE